MAFGKVTEYITFDVEDFDSNKEQKFKIAKWLVEKNDFMTYDGQVAIGYETEKAYKVVLVDLEGETEFWIPKSQCKLVEMEDADLRYY